MARRSFRIALAALLASLALMPATGAEAATTTVDLDMSALPSSPWTLFASGGASSVSGGVLTIDTIDVPGDNRGYHLGPDSNPWAAQVSHTQGWAINARVRIDPRTPGPCSVDPPMEVIAEDDATRIEMGFSASEVCLWVDGSAWISSPLDTTVFHTYRLEQKAGPVQLSVDGTPRLSGSSIPTGNNRRFLEFGDFIGDPSNSKAFWDDLSYEVTPGPPPPQTTCDGLQPTIVGSPRDDRIVGTSGRDVIVGGGGRDVITGGGGDDVICGEDGNDALYGEAGNDLLIGGPDNDQMNGGNGADRLFGGAGQDTLGGDAGNDVVHGDDDDDVITGGDGRDYLVGGPGADRIHGNADPDELRGGDGPDSLYGDAGDDVLRGDTGVDSCAGGTGTNTISPSCETAG
jgi:hypothetical protein